MNLALFQYSEGQLLIAVLTFLRLTAFIFSMPIIGASMVPSQLKILLSLLLCFIISPVLIMQPQNAPFLQIGFNSDLILFAFAREVFIGLFLGFLFRFFFWAIEMSGQLMSLSIGLSAAQMFNPALDSQSSVIDQFQVGLATLVFLMIGGHHHMLSGLVQSYEFLPLSFDGFSALGVKSLIDMAHESLVIGLKLSSPIVISILLTNLAMGIIGRAVPQINVLATSLQMTIIVGLVVMFAAIPFVIEEMRVVESIMLSRFFDILKTL